MSGGSHAFPAQKRTNDYPLQIQRSAPLPAWASDPRKSALMMEVDTLLMKKRYDDLRLKIAEGEALGGLPLNKARCAVALYDVLSTIGEGCLRDPELQLPVLERAVKDAALSGLQARRRRARTSGGSKARATHGALRRPSDARR